MTTAEVHEMLGNVLNAITGILLGIAIIVIVTNGTEQFLLWRKRKREQRDMASGSELQKKFEEAMRQANAQSNSVHGHVIAGGSFTGPPYIPTTGPNSPNETLLLRLRARMDWAKVGLALRGIYAVEMPDKVVVFLALQDKYLTLEDDPTNYPSDKLIAALRLLQ